MGPEKCTGPGLKPLDYGPRIIMLWAIMLPQIAIGAYIALVTWIPAAMMSEVGALVVLPRWRNDSHSERARQPQLGVEVQ